MNEYGQISYNERIKLAERVTNFELDIFQIMPNYMHGIIVLNDVGSGFTPAQNADTHFMDTPNTNTTGINMQNTKTHLGPTAGVAPTMATANATIGDIVGAYKSLVANGCWKIYKSKNEMMGKLWQHNYYENIIHNEQLYQRISNYIINNPSKWNDDKFFTK